MKRFLILASLIAVLAMIAACAPAPQPTAVPQPTAAPAPTQAPPPTAAPQPTTAPQPTAAQPTTAPTTGGTSTGASMEGAKAAGLTALADAYDGKLKGKVVTMTGPFTDEDAVKFASTVKAFEDATGIDIQYEGSKEFEASIAARIAAGDAPDIIDFPQPGLLATFAKQGKIVDASKLVPMEWLQKNYIGSWLDMANLAGQSGNIQGGVWHRFNGKSLVWYPKKAFDAAGYKVPTTWAELEALQNQIVSDGDTPWCIGIESGAATGWVATDWTEDMMLRTTSPENYDKWVRGELKFDSPEVRKAIESFAKIWNDDKMVKGGRAAIVSTTFQDAPTGMFENPPTCWLHRQGNFVTSFFPKDAVAGVDYDVFYLPGIDDAQGKPFLVAGDIMAATNDKPETAAVMQFFSTGEGVKGWLAAGGALGPQKDVNLDWYGADLERNIAKIASEATTVRFDASDLMPGAVGAGSFWKGMTDYFSGSATLDQVLPEIDKSFPSPQ